MNIAWVCVTDFSRSCFFWCMKNEPGKVLWWTVLISCDNSELPSLAILHAVLCSKLKILVTSNHSDWVQDSCCQWSYEQDFTNRSRSAMFACSVVVVIFLAFWVYCTQFKCIQIRNPTQASLQFTVSFFAGTPKYQSQQILSKHSKIPSQATNHNNRCFQNTKFARNWTNVNTWTQCLLQVQTNAPRHTLPLSPSLCVHLSSATNFTYHCCFRE